MVLFRNDPSQMQQPWTLVTMLLRHTSITSRGTKTSRQSHYKCIANTYRDGQQTHRRSSGAFPRLQPQTENNLQMPLFVSVLDASNRLAANLAGRIEQEISPCNRMFGPVDAFFFAVVELSEMIFRIRCLYFQRLTLPLFTRTPSQCGKLR